MRLNVLCVDCVGGRNIILWTRSRVVGAWLRCATIGRRVIRRSCFSGRCDCAVVKGSRPGSSGNRGLALIYGSPQLRVGACSLHMLSLNGYRGDVSVACCHLVLRPRAGVYPAVTAVVADTIQCRGVIDHRCVVNVVNVGDVHIVHRAVIKEPAIVPASAFVALAEITVAVTDSAIETYVRTPIALIEKESVAPPRPIAGRPEQANLRSFYPRARHPVVITFVVIVGPIARRPYVTLAGAKRLLVDGQGRRTERNRYADLLNEVADTTTMTSANNNIRMDGMICICFPPCRYLSPARCCSAAPVLHRLNGKLSYMK